MTMRTTAMAWMGLLAAALAFPTTTIAQARTEPYNLGMFRESGRAFVGVVIDDAVAVDLSRADPSAPPTLKTLIERWDESWSKRIAGLAAAARQNPPAYVFPIGQVTTSPPLSDPDVILMAARNYVEHAEEMANIGRRLGTTSVIDESVRIGTAGHLDSGCG
jgi:hypothetical protein